MEQNLAQNLLTFTDVLIRSARLAAYNKIVHCVVNSFYHCIPSALSLMMF